ncbi:MAG: AI-2E family transporter, partial [Verrucomicrobiae bacterium]|nr:AI-2E family transporter [Verrucomicrobiae bacterium]
MDFPPPTPKQARLIWTAVTGLAIALIVALLVTLVWGLGRVLNVLAPVLWPLAIAGVIAYLLDPVVDALQRRGTPRVRAIVIVFAMAVVFVLGIFGSIVPQVVIETRQLVRQIPAYATNVTSRVEGWIKHPPSSVLRSLGLSLGGTNDVTVGVVSTNEVGVTNTSPDAESADTNATATVAAEPAVDLPASPGDSPDSEAGGTDVLAKWLREVMDMDTLQS